MAKDGGNRRPIGPIHDMGPPGPNNPIVGVLKRYGVPRCSIISLMVKGNELRDLKARYRDFTIFLAGPPPTGKLLATAMSFEDEKGRKIIDVWQIAVYWKDYDHCAVAMWSVEKADFTVSIQVGQFGTLSQEVGKHLANDGLALLKWVQARISKPGRNKDTGDLDNIPLDEMIIALAYLQADHANRNIKAPTIYDLAAYYGKARTTLWRYLSKKEIGFYDLSKEAEKISPTLPIEVMKEKLKKLNPEP